MINFTRDGDTVIAKIEANVSTTKRLFSFSWKAADEVYAELLTENLNCSYA